MKIGISPIFSKQFSKKGIFDFTKLHDQTYRYFVD